MWRGHRELTDQRGGLHGEDSGPGTRRHTSTKDGIPICMKEDAHVQAALEEIILISKARSQNLLSCVVFG